MRKLRLYHGVWHILSTQQIYWLLLPNGRLYLKKELFKKGVKPTDFCFYYPKDQGESYLGPMWAFLSKTHVPGVEV